MRILFMGTPDISAYCLQKLIDKNFDIVGVVCRADKPKGRGHKLMPPEAKVVAMENNISVFQPETLKNGELKSVLDELKPDLIVVVAYGRILPDYVLEYPKYGCINMHASILPKYRGAAPIQWAIINGDSETAATVMRMDSGLDTGDVLLEKRIKIGDTQTAGELFDEMAKAGAEVLVEAIENIDTLKPKKQTGEAVYAPMITKEIAHINWNNNKADIVNLIRGLNPVPLAYSEYEGEAFKIISAVCEDGDCDTVGKVISADKNGIKVACADGSVLIKTVRFAGKKTMSVEDYLRGNEIKCGVILS